MSAHRGYAGYDHVQGGRLQYLLWGIGVLAACLGAFVHAEEPQAALVLWIVAPIMMALPALFSSLQVKDEGDHLLVRFGPVPLIKRRMPYAEMIAAEPAKSRLIDGWGIHYGPGRGWIWNLWGYDCVSVQQKNSEFRIGTDDPEGLSAFLSARIAAETGSRATGGRHPDDGIPTGARA